MLFIIITSIFKLDRNLFENACYAWCIYSYRPSALEHIVGSTFVYILTTLFLLYLKTHTPCIFSKFWSFCSTKRATCTFILIRLDINKTLTNKWQHNFFKCNFSLYNRSYKISIDLTGANRPNNVRNDTTGNLEIGKRNIFYLK